MGNNSSISEVTHTQTELVCTDRNLLRISIKIPKQNRLNLVNLAGNQLIRLPKHLDHLAALNLSRNQITEFNIKMLKTLRTYRNLQVLDISSNSISEIPSDFKRFKLLKRFLASHNSLSKFENLSDNLEVVDLMQNRFKEFPQFNSNICLICLDCNLIEKLETEFPSLVRLHINMNKLTFIKPDMVFPKLERLEISKNRLQTLPDFSKFAPKLQKIDCSLNFIREFPKFSNEIIEINISGNQLCEIPESLIELTKLSILDISSNNLEAIPPLPPSITSLTATSNKIVHAGKCNTPLLKTLYIMKNKLDDLPEFENNQVTEYFITKNCISTLPISCFSPLITRITAIYNQIEELPTNLFQDLPKLKYLNLTKNNIKKLPIEMKDSSLICLTLSENPLEDISIDCLPESLVSLYCSYTNITEIPDQILNLPHLETLVSSGNSLTRLPNLSGTNLKKLLMSRNNFTEMPELPNSLVILDFSCNKLQSIPTNFSFPSLIEADFSYNDIKNLPEHYDCMRLKSFKISHNPSLEGELDIQHFPFIDCFDISFTSLHLSQDERIIEDIREIVVSDPSLFTSSKYKLVTEEGEYTSFSEMKGQRDMMEDSIVVRPNLFKDVDLYCVFDGHGGKVSSIESAYKIVHICQEDETAEISEEFVLSLFEKLDQNLKDLEVSDGSTIALVLADEENILFAHLGDSRALLITEDGKIKHATIDHKPESRGEIDRILEIGGKVEKSRTDGSVAVSRCLGDFSVFGIGKTPEIFKTKLDPEDRWLVIGCDGLYDVMTNDDVGQIAQTAETAVDLAYDLRNIAYNRLCRDNISTVVVDLKNRPKKQSD